MIAQAGRSVLMGLTGPSQRKGMVISVILKTAHCPVSSSGISSASLFAVSVCSDPSPLGKWPSDCPEWVPRHIRSPVSGGAAKTLSGALSSAQCLWSRDLSLVRQTCETTRHL